MTIGVNRKLLSAKSILWFAFLKKNLKIPNGCLFWRLKNSLKLGKARLDPRWLKNFGEIALCRTVFEI